MHLPIEPQPLAQAIKAKTEAAHKETEAVLFPKLMAIESADDYAAILKMFYGFFHPLEEKIQAFIKPSVLNDIESRRTSTLILDDLKALDLSIEDLPLCTFLPEINNTAQAFGAMYVAEGSTLGGKMIAKMLLKNEAVPANALNFFSGYKEKTGMMWTNFLAVLNAQHEANTIIAAANETFLHLKSWMQRSLTH